MKLLLIIPPYDPDRGIGIPVRTYVWLMELLKSVDIDSRLITADENTDIRVVINKMKPDITFSPAYNAFSSSGSPVVIHQLLEEMGIPYIGSSPQTLELVLDKGNFKQALRKWELPTPAYWVYKNGLFFDEENCKTEIPRRYPFILKPMREGNSRGITVRSIVWCKEELNSRLETLSRNYMEILIEAYLGADLGLREFTVAMIGNGEKRYILPAEIHLLVKHKHRIITMKDKTQHGTQARTIKEPLLIQELIKLAADVFTLIQARDYSRCDILMANGHLTCIEVNGQPMIPDKWFDACTAGIGMRRRDYCLAIFLAGMMRLTQDKGSTLKIPSKLKESIQSWM